MKISDKKSSELIELDEHLQGVFKRIDKIQNRIDETIIDDNSTPENNITNKTHDV
jgi:hypothetical protein